MVDEQNTCIGQYSTCLASCASRGVWEVQCSTLSEQLSSNEYALSLDE